MKIILADQAEKWLPILCAKSMLVKSVDTAKEVAKKIRFPVVLKLVSAKAVHKSEVKGVRIVQNEIELETEFVELTKIAKAKNLPLQGIFVQEFVSGKELIIGLKKDATFDHAIMLGIGGIFVELLKDVSFRICPIQEKDAEEMIQELKGKNLLGDFRGSKAINHDLLKKTLVKLSQIPEKHKNIVELDINPFIINDKEGKVVDVRIIVE